MEYWNDGIMGDEFARTQDSNVPLFRHSIQCTTMRIESTPTTARTTEAILNDHS